MIDRTSGASRFYKSAIATSALPLLALGSTAAATPAVADAPGTALSPKPATTANIQAAQQTLQATLKPTQQLAVQLPARFTQSNFQAVNTAPATYTVKSGDTIGHISLDQNVSLSNLLKWNDLKLSSTIHPGDVLKLGASDNSSTATTASSTASTNSYTVEPGDTLSGIAANQDVALSTLLRANGLSVSSIIYPGQTMKLSGDTSSSTSSKTSNPAASNTSSGMYKVKSGDTLSGIAASQNVSLSTLLQANGLSSSTIIYPGQQLRLSNADDSSVSTASSTTSSSKAPSSDSYTVKSGDTLSGIAARNGVSLSTLVQANDLSLSSTIFPGQKISLSSSAGSSSKSSVSTASSDSTSSSGTAGSYTVTSGDTLSGIAAKQGVSVSTLRNANDLSGDDIRAGQTLKWSGSSTSTRSSTSDSSSNSDYKVKSGDTLSGIAARNDMSLSELLEANGMNSTDIIREGQTLQLSGSGSTSTASSDNDDQLVGDTFLHRTYPDEVVSDANDNKRALLNSPIPSRGEVRDMVRSTASSMGVDPALALAHAQVESGFNAAAVSPANAIGIMQVIPASGEWASQLVGRNLNLMDPQDNITAGVAIIRHLQNRNPGDTGIAGYYQGEGGVAKNGMYDDTKDYVKKINEAKSRY